MDGALRRRRRLLSKLSQSSSSALTEPQVAEYVFALAKYCNWSSRPNARMKHLYSGLRKLSVSVKAAAMIGQRLGVDPSFRKAIHFPWLAEKTTGPAVFRTFTLVMCQGSKSRTGCFFGGGHCSPSWRRLCGHRRLLFASVCSVILPVSATRCIGGITLAQLKEVTSTCSRLFRASLAISSSCLAILSSIQSAPH